MLNKLKKLRRYKIKTMLIACTFLILWGIAFPSSLPRNFARFLILITTAGVSDAAYFPARDLGNSGSAFFLIKAISFGGRARDMAVIAGVSRYNLVHGENQFIDRAIFDAFFETKSDGFNRTALIRHMFSANREYDENTKQKIDFIYQENLSETEKEVILRRMKNNDRFPTLYLQQEVQKYRDTLQEIALDRQNCVADE